MGRKSNRLKRVEHYALDIIGEDGCKRVLVDRYDAKARDHAEWMHLQDALVDDNIKELMKRERRRKKAIKPRTQRLEGIMLEDIYTHLDNEGFTKTFDRGLSYRQLDRVIDECVEEIEKGESDEGNHGCKI